MDNILDGVLASHHSAMVKINIIKKIQVAVENKPLSVVQLHNIVSKCSSFLLRPSSPQLVEPIRDLFFVSCKRNSASVTFVLTPDFIAKALSSRDIVDSASVPFLLGIAIPLYQKDAKLYQQLSNSVSSNLLNFITYHGMHSVQAIDRLLTLCLQNPLFLPRTSPEACCQLTKVLLRFLANLQLSSNLSDVVGFVSSVETVSDVVEALWLVSSADSLRRTIALFFSFVADESNPTEPHLPLAAVMRHIRLEFLGQCIRELVDIYESDETAVKIILFRLTSFLRWPRSTHLDSWIIMLLLGLRERGRAVLILEYIRDNVVPVIRLLPLRGIARQSVTTLLEFMLLTYQHTHELVELVAKELPDVCLELRQEDSPSARQCLTSLAEMGHILTHMHKVNIKTMPLGVVNLLREFPAPSIKRMNERIRLHKWTNMAKIQPAEFTKNLQVKRRSETGCVGLLNVGNTCYANAALQLLFNCPDFRHAVLNRSSSVIKRSNLCSQLYSVFVSLENSKIAVSDPAGFIRVTRPSHFKPGEQQDAAEYLGHLLDRLHEEERAIAEPLPQSSSCSCPSTVSSVVVDDAKEGYLQMDVQDGQQLGHPMTITSVTDLQQTSPPNESQTTLVQSLFRGSMHRLTACNACKHQSLLQENFYFLFLPLSPTTATTTDDGLARDSMNGAKSTNSKSSDVVEDIGHLVRQHLASVEDIPDTGSCEQCGRREGTRRTMALNRLPPYVFLCLNLFTFNRATQSCTKLLRRFRVPEFLPVVPVNDTCATSDADNAMQTEATGFMEHLSEPPMIPSQCHEESPPPPPEKPLEAADPPRPDTQPVVQNLQPLASGSIPPPLKSPKQQAPGYTLMGMIVHHGVSMSFGHYTTVCRVGVNWVWFDDDTARYTQLEQVGAEASCTPYLLLYSRNS